MKTDNPFDKKLREWDKDVPGDIRDAAVYVTDTLELSWSAAQAVFEEKATPELALAIYDRITAKILAQSKTNQH
jgi:hypothetical protein